MLSLSLDGKGLASGWLLLISSCHICIASTSAAAILIYLLIVVTTTK